MGWSLGLLLLKKMTRHVLILILGGAPFSYKAHMNHDKTHKFPLRSLSPARSLTGARGIWPRASVNVRALPVIIWPRCGGGGVGGGGGGGGGGDGGGDGRDDGGGGGGDGGDGGGGCGGSGGASTISQSTSTLNTYIRSMCISILLYCASVGLPQRRQALCDLRCTHDTVNGTVRNDHGGCVGLWWIRFLELATRVCKVILFKLC
jgi:hypothetical protein